MNVLAVFSLIAFLGILVLAGLVLGRDYHRPLYQVFGLFSIAMAIWGLGFTMLYSSPDKEVALFWIRFYEIGLVFIPSTFYHFVVVFLSLSRRAKLPRKLIYVGYALSSIFFVFIWTPFFAKGVASYSWGYYPIVGIASRLFNLMFGAFVFLGIYELFRSFRIAPGRKRNQIKYVFVASLIGFGAGITNFLPLYGIKNTYPLGHFGAPVALAILAYAIVRHHLMDINIVVRKSVIYSALTAAVAAAYVGTVFVLQTIFQSLTGYKSVLPAIVVALIIALTFEPARRNIQLFIDKTFFKKRYEYQQVMKSASETLRSAINPVRISSFLLDTVVDTLQVAKGWLMLFDRQSEHYIVTSAYELPEEVQFTLRFGKGSRLAEYLMHKGQPIWLDNPDKKILRRRVDEEERKQIEKLGVSLVVPLRGKSELVGMLFLSEKKSGDIYNQDDTELLTALCNQAAISIENSRLYDELQASYLNTVRSLAAALEAKDEYTRGHSERVAKYARDIAREMGLPQAEAQLLYEVSLLHDVGKIGISEEILNKPTKLSKKEFDAIRDHSATGEKILSSIESLKEGLPIIRHHHERLNGDGYPDGLSEVDIPLPARILAVADAFDAMTTKRPYRPAMTAKEAIIELKKFSCHQFDPHVVRAFLAVLSRQKGALFRKPAAVSRIRATRRFKTA